MCCFDFDGLLADTAALWNRAYADLCSLNGVGAEELDPAPLAGASVASAALALSDQLGVEVDSAALLESLQTHFRAEPPRALPGVTTLLERLPRRMPALVVTNGPKALVERSLVGLGLRSRFAAVISAEDVERAKPAPDVYVTACRYAAVPRANAIAFEDSPTGLRSARAAGLRVVGVPANGHSLDADLVVERIDDPQVFSYLGLT